MHNKYNYDDDLIYKDEPEKEFKDLNFEQQADRAGMAFDDAALIKAYRQSPQSLVGNLYFANLDIDLCETKKALGTEQDCRAQYEADVKARDAFDTTLLAAKNTKLSSYDKRAAKKAMHCDNQQIIYPKTICPIGINASQTAIDIVNKSADLEEQALDQFEATSLQDLKRPVPKPQIRLH